MARLVLLRFISLSLSLLLSPGVPFTEERLAWATSKGGIFVTDIAIDPKDSNILYVTTGFSIGVLKSIDGGNTWHQINKGLKSFAGTQILIDPNTPDHLYLSDGCAGLYISLDGGRTWMERNDDLQNSEIGVLVLHPSEEGTLYGVTTRGTHKAIEDGKTWQPFNQGDDFTKSFEFIDLLVFPTRPTTYLMASKKGLYKRTEGDSGWVSVGEPFVGKQISALARDPQTGRLYAAIFRRGSSKETLREGGLFISDDGGGKWAQIDKGLLQQIWVRSIIPHPTDPNVLYLGTSRKGVLKSTDGGKTWKESNTGLTDPDKEIRTVVIDPRNPTILYAGSYGYWVYKSIDSGKSWKPLPLERYQSQEQLLAKINQIDEEARKNSKLSPPASFEKCNRCHGWTDPHINAYKGSWRVATNRRDWGPSVYRMRKDASLNKKELIEITEFLNAYTGSKTKAPNK